MYILKKADWSKEALSKELMLRAKKPPLTVHRATVSADNDSTATSTYGTDKVTHSKKSGGKWKKSVTSKGKKVFSTSVSNADGSRTWKSTKALEKKGEFVFTKEALSKELAMGAAKAAIKRG
jgi:hypothetical protein